MKERNNEKRIQKEILSIFKEVVKLCEEHKIKYFIVGGTMLGAVRHKGFIPWDDDLDIGMTRDNYDKFLKIASSKLPADLFLQTYNTEKNTPFYFSKVRKNKTIFMEKYAKGIDMHHGMYIDIFPFDNVPDDELLRKKQLRNVKLWLNFFVAKSLKGSSVPQHGLVGKFKVLIRNSFHYLLKPVSKDYLFKKVDFYFKQYNNIDCEKVSYIKEPKMALSKNSVNDLIEIEFETERVKCPKNPRLALERQYGDFMKYPDKKDRVGHRPIEVKFDN